MAVTGRFVEEHAGDAAADVPSADGLGIDVSIVLPTYNERENIVALIDDLRGRLSAGKSCYEIIVVDDSSPDGTGAAVTEAFSHDTGVALLMRRENPGLAFSIRAGIERAAGGIIVVMDTDFNHAPKDAVLLFEITRHVDLAIGSRFTFGGGMSNRFRYYASYLYNIFLRLSLGTRMDENLSGFFAIRRERMFELDFDKIFWGYGDYFFRLLLLSQARNFLHVEIPITYGERVGGESKTSVTGIFIRYTREVLYLLSLKLRGQW